MKTLRYSNVKYTPRVPLICCTVEKIKCEIFDFVLLFSSFFPHTYLKKCIAYTMIFIPNNCSTIRDFPFLGQSCMRAKVGKLSLQTHITDSLLHGNFVHTYTHNLKTKGRIKTHNLTNDCSTIEDIYFLGYSCM